MESVNGISISEATSLPRRAEAPPRRPRAGLAELAEDVSHFGGTTAPESLAEELSKRIALLAERRPLPRRRIRPGSVGAGPLGPVGLERAAVAVVHLPLPSITEHLEGPLDFLESLGGLFLVLRIHVGVVLPRVPDRPSESRPAKRRAEHPKFCNNPLHGLAVESRCRSAEFHAFPLCAFGPGSSSQAANEFRGIASVLELRMGTKEPSEGWHAVTTRSAGSACCFPRRTCRPAASPRDGMPPKSRIGGRPLAALLACAALLAAWPGIASAAGGGQLLLTVTDGEGGPPVACRMHLKTAGGKSFRPKKIPSWHDHFLVPGKILLELPVGGYSFELERGPEYPIVSGHFEINNFADDAKVVAVKRHADMAAEGWYSGDLEVRRPVADIQQLHGGRGPARGPGRYLVERQKRADRPTAETTAGQLRPQLLLPPPGRRIQPGRRNLPATEPCGPATAARNGSRVSADGPTGAPDGTIRRAAGSTPRGRIAGTCRCWSRWARSIRSSWPTTRCAATSTSRARPTAGPATASVIRIRVGATPAGPKIYFHLLECGLRIPPSAGSGSGLTPNPPGYNRMYVHVDGELSYEKWWESFRRAGDDHQRPALAPSVEGEPPGHVFAGEKGQTLEFEIGLTLSTREQITYLEIVKNGQVLHNIRFEEYSKSGKLPKVAFSDSGWFLIRGVAEQPNTYRFAMTAPYFVQFDYQPRISKKAVQFFLDWIVQRARQLNLPDPDRRREVIEYHRKARDFWQALLSRANAE